MKYCPGHLMRVVLFVCAPGFRYYPQIKFTWNHVLCHLILSCDKIYAVKILKEPPNKTPVVPVWKRVFFSETVSMKLTTNGLPDIPT